MKRTASGGAPPSLAGRWLVAVALLAVAAGAFTLLQRRASPPAPIGAADAAAPGGERPAQLLAADRMKDAAPLVGRWVRSDAPYTIEVRGISADGRVDARYLNPQPINVSRATVGGGEQGIELFLELSDRGYPGSYYRLTYDAGADRLAGVYNQLVIHQVFDVVFAREQRPPTP